MFNNLKYGIIIENSKIPQLLSIFISIKAITIWPFIIIKGFGDKRLIVHERIHILQQKELFVLPFYILYVFFWILNIFRYWGSENIFQKAYQEIPFEREAYANDSNDIYLMTRKKFNWKNYM